MNLRSYALVSSVIFALVAVVHVLRVVQQWDLVLDGWRAPMWASIAAAIVSGFLAYVGFRGFQQLQRLT